MMRFLFAATALTAAFAATPASAGEWRLVRALCPDLVEDARDRAESRADRAENRIDRAVTWSRRDRREDRRDRAEDRRDRLESLRDEAVLNCPARAWRWVPGPGDGPDIAIVNPGDVTVNLGPGGYWRAGPNGTRIVVIIDD
jgi:hypothetical protein